LDHLILSSTENWLHQYITQDKYALPCNLISGALGTIIVLVPAIGYFDGSASRKMNFSSQKSNFFKIRFFEKKEQD
jgi:hypothetical protein